MQRNLYGHRTLFPVRDWLYAAVALCTALVGILIVEQALQSRADVMKDQTTAQQDEAQAPQSDAGPAPWQ
jgi:hypothetical protein